METLAIIVKEVNAERDANSYTLARKAMILTGLSTPDDGVWRTSMLKKELRVMIEAYPEYFSGERRPEFAASSNVNSSFGEGDDVSTTEHSDAASQLPSNDATLTEQTNRFADRIGPGFSDNIPVSQLMELFDGISGRDVQAESNRDFHDFGDELSLRRFREVMREVYSEPLPLMPLPATLSARQSDARGMRADLTRNVRKFIA